MKVTAKAKVSASHSGSVKETELVRVKVSPLLRAKAKVSRSVKETELPKVKETELPKALVMAKALASVSRLESESLSFPTLPLRACPCCSRDRCRRFLPF